MALLDKLPPAPGLEPAEEGIPNPQLVELIKAFTQEKQALGEYNANSAGTVRRRLMAFATQTQVSIEDIDVAVVRGYFASIEGIRPSTRAARLSALTAFFNWACVEEHMGANPAAGVKRPKVPKGENRSLTLEEVVKVKAQVKGLRNRLIFSLLHGEGLRVNEVALLQVHDVDLSSGVLYVRGKGYGGQRSRKAYMSPDTQKLIVEYSAEQSIASGPLIRSKLNSAVGPSPKTIGELVSGWMRKAGVKRSGGDGVSAHALRHTFAEEIANHTNNIRVVQAALGHQNLSTTQTYLRREVDGLADAQAQRWV